MARVPEDLVYLVRNEAFGSTTVIVAKTVRPGEEYSLDSGKEVGFVFELPTGTWMASWELVDERAAEAGPKRAEFETEALAVRALVDAFPAGELPDAEAHGRHPILT